MKNTVINILIILGLLAAGFIGGCQFHKANSEPKIVHDTTKIEPDSMDIIQKARIGYIRANKDSIREKYGKIYKDTNIVDSTRMRIKDSTAVDTNYINIPYQYADTSFQKTLKDSSSRAKVTFQQQIKTWSYWSPINQIEREINYSEPEITTQKRRYQWKWYYNIGISAGYSPNNGLFMGISYSFTYGNYLRIKNRYEGR